MNEQERRDESEGIRLLILACTTTLSATIGAFPADGYSWKMAFLLMLFFNTVSFVFRLGRLAR